MRTGYRVAVETSVRRVAVETSVCRVAMWKPVGVGECFPAWRKSSEGNLIGHIKQREGLAL